MLDLSAQENTLSKAGNDGLGLWIVLEPPILRDLDLSHEGMRAETRCMMGVAVKSPGVSSYV